MNWKLIVRAVVTQILLTALIYGVQVFVSLKLDATQWTESARAAAVILWIWSLIINFIAWGAANAD